MTENEQLEVYDRICDAIIKYQHLCPDRHIYTAIEIRKARNNWLY